MIVKGNPKRTIIGLWVLAAILILWYNTAALTSLLDQPLAGLSPQARETITKWQRLEIQIASQQKETLSVKELEKYLSAIDIEKIKTILPAEKTKPNTDAAKKMTKPVQKKKIVLPKLNGVVAIHDAGGKTSYLAVVDGQTREAKSRIGDFRLERIDASGILLSQGGESWFIHAPQVAFSVDNSRTESTSGLDQ
jgi:hypothetical protein